MDKLEERLNHAAAFVAREGEINFPLLLSEAADALAAKQALIDELVDGLKPFAREADDWPDKMDCEDIPADATDIKIEDLRRARSLISKARSSGKAGSDA